MDSARHHLMDCGQVKGETVDDVYCEAIQELQGKLVREPPWPSNCCIFRVPSTIRRHNVYAFEPQLVSIGPYYHGQERFQPMETFKLWYLGCLLDRASTRESRLECLFKVIGSNVQHCLDCYAEKDVKCADDFVEMMILDGCFVLELFRKKAGIVPQHPDDPIFKTSYMKKILLSDLLLLENQLPWYVLESIFYLTASHRERADTSLVALALKFFGFSTIRSGAINPNIIPVNKHLLDLQRNNLLSSYASVVPEQTAWHPIPCVTKLLQAGVRFESGESSEMMDVQFKNGVMRIPPIMILDNAESLIRNLIAYEQCDATCRDKITSYAILLNNLIESERDLDYLCQKGIVDCYLNSEEICSFFRRLYSDADVVYYTYAKLSQDVNLYCMARWPTWRATLLRDYFNNPWSILSFVAAILFLFLNFLQVVFSILSYRTAA
ncbi:UPF0481 protein At3g47200-like [Punica granatum]|uniref:UPF0481 protein At3g47200-like n=1 Tax=Punica granatum TaxID=22663 RepID=A0A6P8CWV1_PUNGR|nr:UPF0481 protein At3g47200-like [Punica granatum]